MPGPDWDFTKYVDTPPSTTPPPPSFGHPTSSSQLADFGLAGHAAEPAVGASVLTSGRQPVVWLALCLAVLVVGVVTASALGASPALAITAWVLSGPVAIGLLAAYTTFDTRARASGVYASRGWVRALYVGCLILCGVAVCLSAVRIAAWVGRL